MTQPADTTMLAVAPASGSTPEQQQQQKQMSGSQQQQSISPHRSSFDIDLEDGPLFRAIIKEHEGKTSTLKGHLKRILKAAQALSDAKHHLLEQDQLFIKALREAPFTEPLFTHYLDSTWEKLHEQQERLYICMQNILIDPLQKLYEMDIKSVDAKRKRFEDISKDYYSALAKYLSKKAVQDTAAAVAATQGTPSVPLKIPTAPAKSTNNNSNAQNQQNNNMSQNHTVATSLYQSSASTSKSLRQKRSKKTEHEFHVKKNEFDLVRFEYYSFLRDLHGGKKEQEILYHLLNHNEKQYSYFQSVVKILGPHQAGLEELARMIAEASKEQKIVNQERDEIRKILASKTVSNSNNTSISHGNGELDPTFSRTTSNGPSKRKSLLTSISPPLSSMSVFSSSNPKVGGSLALPSSPVSPEVSQSEQPFFADYHASTNTAVDDAANKIDSSRPDHKCDRFKGIRDLEQQDHSLLSSVGRKKEGFLFATSKPIKNIKNNANSTIDNVIWHKYWCVVSGGQLHEYSKWKKHLETHLEPIDLRFATVRENKNVERRFCFEVITPKFKRLYQATSEEELQSWIATINNAINSLLNGSSGSAAHLERLYETSKKSWKQTATFSGALSGLAAAKNKYLRKRSNSSGRRRVNHHLHHQNAVTGSRDPSVSPLSSPPPFTSLFDQRELLSPEPSSSSCNTLLAADSHNPQQSSAGSNDIDQKMSLLKALQQDFSNHICADCSAKEPDWCSINLGVVLCIECSGIHRSLGTHVSKVRSLTLDQASFTSEIIQVMLSMGNAKSNEIWEAKLLHNKNADAVKPSPDSSRDVKLTFIQQKYVKKAFVSTTTYQITKESIGNDRDYHPMEVLYDAIADDDIPLAMYALALGANVNTPFPASCYDTHSPISLLSPAHHGKQQQKQPTYITLPSLDAEGNVKGTMNVPCPPSSLLTSLTMDDLSQLTEENETGKFYVDTFFVRYPLHLALIGFEDQESYPMAEFLLLNGASITAIDEVASGCRLGDLIAFGELVEDNAIAFLNNKNNLRGDALIKRTKHIPCSATITSTS